MPNISRRRLPRRVLIAGSIGCALLLGGATVAVADTIRHDAARASADGVQPNIAGAAHNGNCSVGYDTESATNTPPDDSTADNPPAATVTFTKNCVGAVIANFSAETSAPATSDFIHIDLRATCIATGGQPAPCTVGQQVSASPGHSFFKNGPAPFGVSSIQMVWPGLARGRWTFEVLPGGNNVANLQFRTLTVQSFSGG